MSQPSTPPRQTIADFDPEVMRLFDQYVHGGIDRRAFLDRAGRYAAAAGTTAAGLLAALSPQFAAAQKVAPSDPRIKTERIEIASPAGHGKINVLVARPASGSGALPVVLVIHENRGLLQSAEVWNNVIYTNGAGSTFAILDEDGQVRMRGNSIKPGWRKSHGELKGTISATGMIEAENPGFLDPAKGDYQPGAKSVLRDIGIEAPPKSLPVEFEPPWHNRPGAKRSLISRIDLGCFEGK